MKDGEYTPCGHELTIDINTDRNEAEIRIDGELVATIMQGPVCSELTMSMPFRSKCVARVSVKFGGG